MIANLLLAVVFLCLGLFLEFTFFIRPVGPIFEMFTKVLHYHHLRYHFAAVVCRPAVRLGISELVAAAMQQQCVDVRV